MEVGYQSRNYGSMLRDAGTRLHERASTWRRGAPLRDGAAMSNETSALHHAHSALHDARGALRHGAAGVQEALRALGRRAATWRAGAASHADGGGLRDAIDMQSMHATQRGVHAMQLVLALGLGALLMYAFDPQQGRSRIAYARDQAKRLGRSAREAAGTGARDLGHRAQGFVARVGQAVRRPSTDDRVLAARVRSRLGRVASRAHALRIDAHDGRITVSGPILANEEDLVLQAIRSVRGVREVENQLDVHVLPGQVPALQGGRSLAERQRNRRWTPGPRLLALSGGTALALYGIARRGVPGLLAGAIGTYFAVCAVRNRARSGSAQDEFDEEGRGERTSTSESTRSIEERGSDAGGDYPGGGYSGAGARVGQSYERPYEQERTAGSGHTVPDAS